MVPKKFIKRRIFIAALGAAGGLGAYMRFWEPGSITVAHHKFAFPLGFKRTPLRILHLSDFHASDVVSLAFIRQSLELGIAQQPDLICLTGDFITTTYEDFASYTSALKLLSNSAPTYACIGNHDGGWWARRRGYPNWDRVGEMLATAGVTVLHNRSTVIQCRSEPLQLVGLGDLWAKECHPEKAFANADSSIPTIVLSHNPDSKDLLFERQWQLMLCGHTHGGQLSLPLIGTPFAPVRDQAYVSGLNLWHDRFIHTTPGIGNLHGLRFNCPPEVSVIDVS
jgi:uncharacterized protein